MHVLENYWLQLFEEDGSQEDNWWKRKQELFARRNAAIVNIKGNGHIYQRVREENKQAIHYLLHLSFLVKQHDFFYVEEKVLPFKFTIEKEKISQHQQISTKPAPIQEEVLHPLTAEREKTRYVYDRLAAVKYAERWWNSYNPEYEQFDVDCTNYISQCLYAGGIPMSGFTDREKGWWYQNKSWSFSWSVSHSFRWLLSGSTEGLQGTEVESPEELRKGDVICYDFEGDGRYDHTTIVVAKDAENMPLVNAHTDNSRHRYWSYEDSTAWTPNIAYKFFQINEK